MKPCLRLPRSVFACVALLALAGSTLRLEAEVRSYALGVGVNCPYGLPECYYAWREQMLRLEGVAWVSEEADFATETLALRSREGRLLDPQVVAKYISELGVGARLRGMEATVVGTVEKRDDKFLLRVSGSGEVLPLGSCETKVQYRFETKKPHPRTTQERRAFRALQKEMSSPQRAAVITGPLVRDKKGVLTLQVRTYELPEAKQARAQ
ncbi:MAG: hypothetical protein AB1705_00190 [Verrucomicrobiota bacterium]